MKVLSPAFAAAAFAIGAVASANAAAPEFALTIRHHAYSPSTLEVPAGVRFKIRIENRDPTPEEFESTELNREQIVLPGRSVVVYLGPLPAGTYAFFGDFHRDTAQGRLVAGKE